MQGNIREDKETMIYQIDKKHTNLIDVEQLDELKREDPFFFRFLNGEESKQHVHIYYEKEPGYQSILHFTGASEEIKTQIALQLLSVEKLIGSQYTTILQPTNIYADGQGNVKLAHRGIRSVFPTEELTVPQLLSDVKKVMMQLFSSNGFSEGADWEKLRKENALLEKIYHASSIQDMHNILQSPPRPVNVQEKVQPKKQQPKKQLLTGVLIGLLAGMLLIYVFQVMPMTEAADQQTDKEALLEEETSGLEEENTALQSELEQSDEVRGAYEAALLGNTEEAVYLLEGAAQLDEQAETILFDQYLLLGTAESLEKAVALRAADDPVTVVGALRSLNTAEASQAILTIESDMPEVVIEQAWINEAYETVIETFASIEDNRRAKYLAAHSYMEQGDFEEALQLGEELENKNIQIESLNRQIDEIEDDDDLDESEIEEQVEELEEMIEELE